MRKLASVRAVSIALVLMAAAPRLTLAAWPNDPATNLPLCTAPADQQFVTIASDGAGGAILTWQDFRSGVALDIYAQHVLASGVPDPAWPPNGLAVCTASGSQFYPTIVPDGAGGAIISWEDFRAVSSYDIYAQHVLAGGSVDPAWPVDGVVLCSVAGNQYLPNLVSDGAGGAIAAWFDYRNGANYDVYAQHVQASGTVDPAWPVNGRALCTAASSQQEATIVSDGAGGAIVTWYDFRNGVDLDIYAQHVLAGGAVDPAWPPNGRAVCTAASHQFNPMIATDGAGGAIITWFDLRNGTNYDIYALRVQANGAVDPAWPAEGLAICTAGSDQITPMIVPDGAGGAIITWQDNRTGTDYDIYAQRVLAGGIVDPAWPPDGLALCAAAYSQISPVIAGDASGGAIVSWQDGRNGSDDDIYAQHVMADGTIAVDWPANGLAISTAPGQQATPMILSNGVDSAIITWEDSRSGAPDIYAQRVGPFGYLGTPEPEITGVSDVPDDNGGVVTVTWNASYLDLNGDPNLTAYNVYRSVPPGAWVNVASVSARHSGSSYDQTVPTPSDSTGASVPKPLFMVMAHNSDGSMHWYSRPDSGYSVDNLAPGAPASFTGQFGAGVAHLHWNPNSETDLANYRLYRGTSAGFTPSPANRIASPPDTGFADPAGATYWYKLSAIDIHGNESAFSTLLPAGALDVSGGGLPGALALERPSPNPAAGATTMRYALPREMRVSLLIYDAAGRRVRQLASGVEPAGMHAVAWDLRDDGGRPLGAGLYFVRLEAEGKRVTRRFATLQ